MHVLERLRDQLLNHCVVVADEVRFVIEVEGVLDLSELVVREAKGQVCLWVVRLDCQALLI